MRFRHKDYAHGNRRGVMTLEPQEFIHRFLLHVLPPRLMRIRHYGLLAGRAKGKKLAAARAALGQPPPAATTQTESVEEFWLPVAALDIHQCPHCKSGRMRVVGFVDRDQQQRSGRIVRLNDKTVTLLCGQQQWRVGYGLRYRVVDASSAKGEMRKLDVQHPLLEPAGDG